VRIGEKRGNRQAPGEEGRKECRVQGNNFVGGRRKERMVFSQAGGEGRQNLLRNTLARFARRRKKRIRRPPFVSGGKKETRPRGSRDGRRKKPDLPKTHQRGKKVGPISVSGKKRRKLRTRGEGNKGSGKIWKPNRFTVCVEKEGKPRPFSRAKGRGEKG